MAEPDFAIVSAIDTGRTEPVINDGRAVGLAEEPFGMGIENMFGRLAEIEAADDANSAHVCVLQGVSEHVLPGWEPWAG